MIYKVLVTEPFTDKYTKKVYKVGETIEGLDEVRINEINAVKKTLISIIEKKEAKTTKKTSTEKTAE